MTQQTGTPPGWYPDGHGATRWFDGTAWTKQVQPVAPPVYQPAADPRSVPYQAPPRKPSHTGRNVVLGILGLAVVIAVIASVANSKNKTNNSTAATAGSTTTASGVSQGLGAKNATGDVTIGRLSTQADTTMAQVPVTITNHSSKRSDYFVTVALESADGKTQIDTGDVFVQNLEPGQSSVQTADFLGTATTTAAPAGAKVVLQSVQRTASN